MRFIILLGDEIDEDDDVDPELQIDAVILEDLRNEAQKLKSWRKLNKVRLIYYNTYSFGMLRYLLIV